MTTNATQKQEEKKVKVKRPTAKKRDIQNERRAEANASFRSKVRTAIRSVRTSFEDKESAEEISKKLNIVFSLVDKGTKTKVLKKNTAARVKSRLSAGAKKALAKG
ncbi:MAG: 30S ribosomal protein S20 [Chlamydiota bacterium]